MGNEVQRKYEVIKLERKTKKPFININKIAYDSESLNKALKQCKVNKMNLVFLNHPFNNLNDISNIDMNHYIGTLEDFDDNYCYIKITRPELKKYIGKNYKVQFRMLGSYNKYHKLIISRIYRIDIRADESELSEKCMA